MWARHGEEVQAAQRLRWRVFVDEMGARPQLPGGTPAGLDVDLFDLWRQLQQSCPAPMDEQVRARHPLPVNKLCTGAPAEAAALIKGYLKCGARLLGQPAWDPDFGTADLPLMLKLEDLPAAYRRRFIGN